MLQLNLRLGAEDLGYIVDHSHAAFICVDESLLPLAEAIAPLVPDVRGWIVMTDKPSAEIRYDAAALASSRKPCSPPPRLPSTGR